MSILQKVRGWFSKDSSHSSTDLQRALPKATYNNIKMFLGNYSGSQLNENQALNLSHDNPVFWSCLSLVADATASVDIEARASGESVEHPVKRLLRRPNGHHGKHTFFWLVSAYLEALGRVYVWVQPDNSLIPVNPLKVTQKGSSCTFRYGSNEINANLGVNIIKITKPDLRDPFNSGIGLSQVLSQELDISETASTHELGYLKNNARPDMLINFPGASLDDLQRAKAALNETHRGSRNSGKEAYFNSEKIDVETLTSSFKDLGLIELRKHSDDAIREGFGIPKELLGAKDVAERSGLEGAEYLFSRNKVKPLINLILSDFNSKLLPILGYKDISLVTVDVVPENKKFELEIAKTFSKEIPPHMTINEVRSMQGLPAVKGGDTLGGRPDEPDVEVKVEKKSPSQPLIACKTGPFAERKHFESLFAELGAN